MDQQKQQVKKFYDVLWNQHNKTEIPSVLHQDVVFRGSIGDEKRGIEGFADYVDKIHLALAEYHCEIHDLVAENNQVFAKMYFSGIHRNEFMGYPPTNQKIGWFGAALFTFQEDKISQVWVLGDLKSLEQQLE